MKNLLIGLHEIHSRKFVHKDIKSGNILLNPTTLLTTYIDFGMACFHQNVPCLNSFTGTPKYVAPELVKKENITFEIGKKIDIWALGITFIELCFGSGTVLEYLFIGTKSVNDVLNMIKDLDQETINGFLE